MVWIVIFEYRAVRILVALFGLVGLTACGPPEPLRLGFVGGLSGRVADLGIGGRNGAILAVELRNKAGGVQGRQVELIAEDDQQDPELARQAVSRLIAGKVEAIVGPMTSAMAMATVPLINAAGLVMVAPTVTTNALTGIDDYFFRVVAPTRTHVHQSAEYYLKKLGLRRVAAIYDLRNQAYTQSWLDDFRAAFEAGGGQLVDSVSFTSSGEQLFGELARQLLAAKPDGIVIIANSVDAAMLCQQIRKLDPAVRIGTAEWAATERLIELGGKTVEGVVVAQYVDRDSPSPAYVAFRKAYRERFGQEPGFAGLTAFDAANVVLDALTRKSSGQTLKQAILAEKTFVGAQSPIIFDASGDTFRATYLTTVKGGTFAVER